MCILRDLKTRLVSQLGLTEQWSDFISAFKLKHRNKKKLIQMVNLTIDSGWDLDMMVQAEEAKGLHNLSSSFSFRSTKMLLSSALLLGATLRSALAITIPHDTHDHSHVESVQLPGEWYQPETHPVHKLFRRAPDDGVVRPAVGSPGASN